MADLQDNIEPYLAHLTAHGHAIRTVKLRRSQLERVVAALRRQGNLRVADLRGEDLDRLMQGLRDEGRVRSTMKSLRDAVTGFCRWLTEQGKMLRDPADGLAVEGGFNDELLPPPLSEEQVRQLLDAVPRDNVRGLRNAAVVEVLYGCGLRRSEGMDLDLDDIQRSQRLVHVRAGKGGVERFVPLQAGTLAAIEDYVALRRTLLRGPDHGALFLSEKGLRLSGSTFQRWLQGHARRTLGPAVRVYPHLLRHSIVVHLLRKGVDLRYLQEFLGHADIDTTKLYLRLVPEHLREDYDRAMPPLA